MRPGHGWRLWLLVSGCLATGVGAQTQDACGRSITFHDLDANGVTDVITERRYPWPFGELRQCSSAGGYLYAEPGVTLLGPATMEPAPIGTPVVLPPRGGLWILPAQPFFSPLPAAPFSDGRALPLLGVAIESAPGEVRYGWLRLPDDPREIREIEFNQRMNEPVPLGLPPEPRWLPVINGTGFDLPATGAVAIHRGTVVQFGRSQVNFDLGVSSVVSGPDGWVYGIGCNVVAPAEELRTRRCLFRIRPSGGALEVLGDLGEVPVNAHPACLSAPAAGFVFAAGPDLHRFSTADGTLTRLTASRAGGVLEFHTAPRRLSDGRLYAATALGYARMDPDGSGIQEVPRNSGGDRFTSEPVEDDDGWMYLASRNWVARSRLDGTRFHVRARLDVGPVGAILGALPGRTDLGRTDDGMMYGVVRVRGPRAVVFRLPSNGPPEILQRIHDAPGPALPWALGENEPVTLTDASPRNLLGRLIEQPDGFLYGQLNTGLGVAYRLRTTDGHMEILSQSSLLGSGEWSPGNTLGDPFVVPSRYGIASFAPGKYGVRLLRRLDGVSEDGQDPIGPLLPLGGGAILGVTRRGGFLNEGVLYRVQSDGSGFRLLHHFNGGAGDVLEPSGFLAPGDDGWIYGTSGQGNHYESSPALYRVHSERGGLEKLADLPGTRSPEDLRRFGLMRARNGHFYGTTPRGGRANLGTLFMFDIGTSSVRILHEFGVLPEDRWEAWPELAETSDGWIHGLAVGHGAGQINADGWFRIRLDGSEYEILSRIGRPEGQQMALSGGLSPDLDGSFLAVRSRTDPANPDTPVGAQILRLIPPGSGSPNPSIRIEYDQAPGREPNLWPVGRLARTSTGRWVGATRGTSIALYEFDPAAGQVSRVSVFPEAGNGLPETAGTLEPLTSVLPLGGDAVLLAVGRFGPGGHGAVLREDLSSPNPIAPLAVTRWTLKYGDRLLRQVPLDALFTNAFRIIDVSGGPPGLETDTTGFYYGWLTGVGDFESQVIATDGRWPERLATNAVQFVVEPRPLILTGPSLTAMVGDLGPFEGGVVEGLAPWETGLSLVWRPVVPELPVPGTFALEPLLTATINALRCYQISSQNGILTWVDPDARLEARDGGVAIRFPEIPHVTYTVWQSDTLEAPDWEQIHFEYAAEWSRPYLVNPDVPGAARYFRIEARSRR